jgi:tyramine---L-glutamate ligase
VSCTQSAASVLNGKMPSMKKLKILVFEYITGGGLNKSDLPESLAREGLLMLQSLLDDLAKIDSVEIFIMLDIRVMGWLFSNAVDLGSIKPSPKGEGWVRGNKNNGKDNFMIPRPRLKNVHAISPEQNSYHEFLRLMSLCDAVWPIAPESSAILQSLCEAVEQSGKILLTSPASAVAVAGNKWLTYGRVKEHSITTVPTQRLVDFVFRSGDWVIKPVDGVGCEDSYVVTNHEAFVTLTANLDKEKYLIQPHILGEKTSLSCLFKHGHGWLMCANRQHFELINKQYHLTGITVNSISDISRFQSLVKDVAKAMPELWGYVGIDLIETADEVLVLEINPRLTTSYAGIHEALGINCAEAVLGLLTGDPQLQATKNQPITITIIGQENDAD